MSRLDDATVLILGLGQIGGSIGLDLVNRRLARTVVGYDIDRGTASAARELDAIDMEVDNPEKAAEIADLIVVATPVRTIPETLTRLSQRIKRGAVVVDVGSSKGKVMAAAEKIGPDFPFVGGHPIAGNEGSGFQAASPGKFEGRSFVLTPRSDGRVEWQHRVEELVQALGAIPLLMSAEEHDRALALTSHLPYALAVTLMGLLSKLEREHPGVHRLTGGSFRSATRVAESAPELTLDMFLANSAAVDEALGHLAGEIEDLRELIRSGEASVLRKIVEEAREKREELG